MSDTCVMLPTKPVSRPRQNSGCTMLTSGRCPAPSHVADGRLGQLARWVARQSEGNRNTGLYWAANRALDANPAADLSPLAAARNREHGDREQRDRPHKARASASEILPS